MVQSCLTVRRSLRSSRFPGLLVLVGGFVIAACSSPTAPPAPGPALMCPAPITVTSVDGSALPVPYESPQAVGGEPPIKTTCLPQSGSLFQLGATTVNCTAQDARARTTSCSFTVSVARPPRLSATRFMAFGDSITEGKDSFGQIVANPCPAVLNGLLTVQYASQNISVVNKGFGGERTREGSDRIKTELDLVRPEILLLEEGVNDLSGGDPAAVATMIEALTDMVNKARARGVQVFIATLTPTRPGSPKGQGPAPLIPEANTQIRLLAQREGITLVDLYTGLGGNPDPYVDVDGLHLTEAGYRKVAEIFFNQIAATLGQKTTPASGCMTSS